MKINRTDEDEPITKNSWPKRWRENDPIFIFSARCVTHIAMDFDALKPANYFKEGSNDETSN
jgi:hypothetical protein